MTMTNHAKQISNPTLRSLKQLSILSVSLIALYTGNKAHAQCVTTGTNVTCNVSAVTTNIDIQDPIETVNITSDTIITNTAFSDIFRVFNEATINNNGTILNATSNGQTSAVAGFAPTADLTVNNNAGALIMINGTASSNVAVGADDNLLNRINSVVLNNAGDIEAFGSALAVAGSNNIDTITNLEDGNITGNITLHADNDLLINEENATLDSQFIQFGTGDDTLTNDGTIDSFIINFAAGSGTLTNTENGVINLAAVSGSGAPGGQFTISSSGGLTIDNDGDIILTGNINNRDVFFNTAGSLNVNNTGNIINNLAGTFGGNFALVNTGTGGTNITNSGEISGIGALFSSSATTLTNQSGGTINGTIQISNADDEITNEEGATITLANILLNNGDDIITNTGDITATTTINLGNGVGTVINNESGIITTPTLVTGTANDTITNAGTIDIQDALTVGNGNDTITNSGTLNVQNTINLGNGVNTITNTADGTININGVSGSGQDRIFDANGSTLILNNDGVIELTGNRTNFDIIHTRGTLVVNNTGRVENAITTGTTPNGTDVFVNVVGGTTDITNSGEIIAPTGQRALLHAVNSTATVTNQAGGVIQGIIQLNNRNDTVTNAGEITGNVTLLSGDDRFTLNLDTGTFNGIANAGANTAIGDTLEFESDTTQTADFTNFTNFENLDISGNGNLITNENSISFNNLNLLDNADFTITSVGTFNTTNISGSGDNTIRIEAGSTLNTGDALGNVTQIEVEVAGANNAGQINNTSGAVDLTGANLFANVTGTLSQSDEILIGTGTTAAIGFDGNTGQALTDIENNSILFELGIADGGQAEVTTAGATANEVFLLTNRRNIQDIVTTSNNQSSGAGLDSLLANGGSDLPQAVLNNINNASTVEELNAIVDSTLPQLDASAALSAQTVTGSTLRVVSDRLTTLRDAPGNTNTGVSSGHITQDLQFWGQAFGQRINQGTRDGVAGFDARTRGLVFGADTGAIDNTTIGAAFTYADTEVRADSINTTATDIESFNLALYADYELNKKTHLVGSIGYTYSDNEAIRFDVGGVSGLNAESDFGSHQIQARIIANYDYHPPKDPRVHIIPSAQINYVFFQSEDIEETGAGGANLTTESDSLNILEIGVGLAAQKEYEIQSGILTPEISLAYRYDLLGQAVNTTSTFSAGGPSFTSEGVEPAQGTATFGAGLGYKAKNNVELTLSYDYELKQDFSSHSAFFRAAVPF